MAKDPAISERLKRIEEIIDELEAGDCSREEGDALYEEGQELLAEARELLAEGEGEVIEIS